jgi:hypothetical protein
VEELMCDLDRRGSKDRLSQHSILNAERQLLPTARAVTTGNSELALQGAGLKAVEGTGSEGGSEGGYGVSAASAQM